jgi:membrane peptidoglycan carboxypeptidase
LVAAYHTIANGGRYVEPKFILSMTDNRGQAMLARPQSPAQEAAEAVQTISEAAAFLVTDILSDAAARAPTFGEGGPLTLSRPAAAKTGTTDDWRDNWTVGYTRHLVAGVWAGNTDGRPTKDSSGVLGAAPIWNTFMEAILADEEFLALLEAPSDDEAWAWQPPVGLQLLSNCPPRLTCHPEGDYFTLEWLEMMGNAGPLADSVLYCGNNPVLKLPNMPRLPGQGVDDEAENQNVVDTTQPSAQELARQAVDNAIAWSRENGVPLPSEGCADPLFD